MNTGFFACIIMVPLFALIAIVFAVMKGKAAGLIAGFNGLPKREQELYDKDRIVLDMRNAVIIWTVVMVLGAIGSLIISAYFAIVAYGLWFILLFKDMHIDTRKAYRKYLKENK